MIFCLSNFHEQFYVRLYDISRTNCSTFVLQVAHLSRNASCEIAMCDFDMCKCDFVA